MLRPSVKEYPVRPEISQAIDFLKKNSMDYEDIDLEAGVTAFLGEMDRGLAGSGGSLAMIPTYIEIPSDIPADKLEKFLKQIVLHDRNI